ncbi:MAG: DUF2808 domain-containing protein [Pleurocapsa sp. MO_192.B19]|nr:DUF2808 domain-containing protein [Pleurocapsa sp. MO_192.B19]
MTRKLFASSLIAIATIVAGVNVIALNPTEAVELGNGQRAFVRGPRLISSAATFSNRNSSAATYKFTIEVPKNAGEALKAVQITQKKNTDTVVFKNNKSRAFEGKNIAGVSIPLASIGGESQPGETTVVFDTPVEPGNTVTIAVKPKRNPSTGGVYLFGITAYPTGENSPGLYLGSGRIHIDQD